MLRPDAACAVGVEEVHRTVAVIAAVQRPDGCIPWFAGGVADPWNHVEAAMALSCGGLDASARRAYLWLADSQRRDGSWAAAYRDGAVVDSTVDANFCAYVATGVWHHTAVTGDQGFLERMWPTLERAVDYVVAQQAPGGEVYWARDGAGRVWPGALLTSSASIHLSLRCAAAAARRLGRPRPDWEHAGAAVAAAVGHRPDAFENRDRWSMDWYYPVLGGALRGTPAHERIAAGWERFVVPGLGARCVADRPWVTSAETCELALALDALGLRAAALELFEWVQHLRDRGGGYWTGAVFPEGAHYPEEQTTWSAAAAVLAADALLGISPASGFFRATPGA